MNGCTQILQPLHNTFIAIRMFVTQKSNRVLVIFHSALVRLDRQWAARASAQSRAFARVSRSPSILDLTFSLRLTRPPSPMVRLEGLIMHLSLYQYSGHSIHSTTQLSHGIQILAQQRYIIEYAQMCIGSSRTKIQISAEARYMNTKQTVA